MAEEKQPGLWRRIAGVFSGGSAPPKAPAPTPLRGAPPRPKASPGLESFVLKLPKVELHVHLESSMRPATLLSLAKKNRVRIPAEDEHGVRRWLRFRDFSHFLEVYETISRCLRDPEDFHCLALDFLAEQAIQNVVYSEVHFTVATHLRNGADGDAIAQALLDAARDGEKRLGVRMRLIPDIVRDDGSELADKTLEWALAGRGELVAALGISGNETGPNEPYREHFETARRAGLRLTAHAGEHGGPESLRQVIELLDPERIDHGVRAAEDEELLRELAARRMPLTVCPTSNVVLGVAEDMASHPFDRLYRAGANVSVNSDGSQILATNLVREYLHLHQSFGYGAAELAGLALDGIRQAFLDDDEKDRLAQELHRRSAELGERYLGEAIEPANDRWRTPSVHLASTQSNRVRGGSGSAERSRDRNRT